MSLQTRIENELRKRAVDEATTLRRQDNFAADLRREYQQRRDGVTQAEQARHARMRRRVALLAQTLAPIWKRYQDTYTQQMHVTNVTAFDGTIVTADAYPIIGDKHTTTNPTVRRREIPEGPYSGHSEPPAVRHYISKPTMNDPYVTLFMTTDGQFIVTKVCACRLTYRTELVCTNGYKTGGVYEAVEVSTRTHIDPHYKYVTLDNLPISQVNFIEYLLHKGMGRMSKSANRLIKRQLKRAAKH